VTGSNDLGSDDVRGFLGGAQVGCDYQFGSHFVLGAQADFSLASVKGNHTDVFSLNPAVSENFTAHTDVDRLGTITGRIGYAFERALFYVKGGAAWVHDKHAFRDVQTFAGCSPLCQEILIGDASLTRWGWTAGTGFEYALLPNLSVFVEYDFLHFGSSRIPFRCSGQIVLASLAVVDDQTLCGETPTGTARTSVPVDIRQQVHEIKLGLNWRFNWGKAPGVAKY
jgi:outer membrane immunogenic protein